MQRSSGNFGIDVWQCNFLACTHQTSRCFYRLQAKCFTVIKKACTSTDPELFLLVDKIKTYKDLESARVEGYEVVFGKERSVAENIVPEKGTDTIWDIGRKQWVMRTMTLYG
eukprot:IDg4033t1